MVRKYFKFSSIAVLLFCTTAFSPALSSSVATPTVNTERLERAEDNNEQENGITEEIQTTQNETTDEGLGIPTDELPETQPDGSLKAQPDFSQSADPKQAEGPLPEIQRDFTKLPEPVQRMRTLILNAARKGKIEELRALIGTGETATNFALGGLEGDPIEHLKSLSGDEEGLEILGILIEILEMGYVHLDAGTDEEMYVWPYFFSWPIKSLTPEQKVEMYTVLTAGDVEDSVNFGGYIFYRAGIKPDGSWNFFVSGD
jgi:hypothetical protein